MTKFIKIDATDDLYLKVDPNALGRLFATIPADDQVAVLNAMVEHMRPWRTQWDYISIELEKEEHQELRRELRSVLFPEGV